jgi:hypothetical protein
MICHDPCAEATPGEVPVWVAVVNKTRRASWGSVYFSSFAPGGIRRPMPRWASNTCAANFALLDGFSVVASEVPAG